MKNLLFISLNDHVPWGGSEVLWSETAKQLAGSGHYRIYALLKKWDVNPAPVTLLEKEKIEITFKDDIKLKNRNAILGKLLKRIPGQEPHFHELDSFKGIIKPDLVIISIGDHTEIKIHYYCDYLIKNNIPYVLIVQLATELKLVHGNYIHLFRTVYSNAKRIYFVSKKNREEMELFLAADLPNSEIVNNPFNFFQRYVELEKEPGEYRLACVAALQVYHKGQDLLLQVLGKKKWKERNIKLDLYGTGPGAYHIKELIKYFKLENMVTMNGYVANKEEIWKAHDACIMPSRMEGQSLAMLEAISCGRMVISTKVGGAEELIKNGETGFLIQACKSHLIDEALEDAWQKRNLWVEMGREGRRNLFKKIKNDPVIDFSEKITELTS